MPKFPLVLAVRVHLDAFLFSPWCYVQGVLWRLRGLKLRAHSRFSVLKGRSPRAYALWIVTRERQRRAAFVHNLPASLPPVIVVVDCRDTSDGLKATLASIAAAGGRTRVLLLGGSAGSGGGMVAEQCIETIAELAKWLRNGADRLPWVLTMRPGDRLSPDALKVYGKAIEEFGDTRLFYADDDVVDENGRRTDPHFKPRWNAELARHADFMTDSAIFTCDPALIDMHWPRSALPRQGNPVHLPYVLHHRRGRARSLVPTIAPKSDALPHVTVIIPTRDQVGLLRACINGVLATHYPSVDLLVIDNDSSDPAALDYLEELVSRGIAVLRYPGPFNYSAMHNRAVEIAQGPLLCLLNNDIEIHDPTWLERMAVAALRDDVGAVGAKLLYGDNTIQHAGILTGVGGGAGHAHRLQRNTDSGYFDRAHLPQFVSAVTGACLVVAKDKFQAVGGFDADNFAVAFNDVDLCLKLNGRGWQSYYEPRAVLIHHESKSRGSDRSGAKKARFAGELAALKRIWHTDVAPDPWHHPELSPFCEQFVVYL